MTDYNSLVEAYKLTLSGNNESMKQAESFLAKVIWLIFSLTLRLVNNKGLVQL